MILFSLFCLSVYFCNLVAN